MLIDTDTTFITICEYSINLANPKPGLLVAVGLRCFLFFFRPAFLKKKSFICFTCVINIWSILYVFV